MRARHGSGLHWFSGWFIESWWTSKSPVNHELTWGQWLLLVWRRTFWNRCFVSPQTIFSFKRDQCEIFAKKCTKWQAVWNGVWERTETTAISHQCSKCSDRLLHFLLLDEDRTPEARDVACFQNTSHNSCSNTELINHYIKSLAVRCLAIFKLSTSFDSHVHLVN